MVEWRCVPKQRPQCTRGRRRIKREALPAIEVLSGAAMSLGSSPGTAPLTTSRIATDLYAATLSPDALRGRSRTPTEHLRESGSLSDSAVVLKSVSKSCRYLWTSPSGRVDSGCPVGDLYGHRRAHVHCRLAWRLELILELRSRALC